MATLTLSNGTQIDPTTLDNSPPDPGVVKVMQTIKKLEGGDYNNRSGDGGSSAGAYQWNNDNKPLKPGELPSHWKNAASQYLKDPNAPMTPENQNYVAYQQVKAYKNQGRSPEEIDALWNGASKDASGKYVHNSAERAQEFRTAIMGQSQTGYGYVTPPPLPETPPATAPTPPPQQRGVGGFLQGAGDVLKSAEAPFLGVAAIPTQLLAKALGKPDPFAQGIPAGIPGLGQKADVTPLSLEKKAGDIAQVGSYFIPGGEGLGALAGATGMGALQGAGAAMSQGKSLSDVAAQGALGAGTGGILAGGALAAGTGLRALGDTISGAGAQKALQGIKNAYSSALNLNASERAFEQRQGKDLAQVLLDHQAPLARNENGTLDASGAIEKLQAALNPLNEQAQKVLAHPQGVVKDVSLADTLQTVKDRIQKLTISQVEKNAAMRHAEELLTAEARQYGAIVSPQTADQIKQGLWGSSFRGKLTSTDKLQGNVSYLAGNALKTDIEKAVAGTDAGNVLPELNRQRSDLIDAIKRLSNLDGVRILRGGRLGNIAGGVVGSVAGAASGLGPLGALAGDYFGVKAAQFLNNPATKISAERLKARTAGILPGLLKGAAKPVGGTISKTGQVIQKSARPVGLLGNLLTK